MSKTSAMTSAYRSAMQNLPPVLSSLCTGYALQDYQDYYMDGTLQTRGQYYGDDKCDLWTYWYPNGTLKAQGHWEDDEKIGVWTVWTQDGQSTSILYKKGA